MTKHEIRFHFIFISQSHRVTIPSHPSALLAVSHDLGTIVLDFYGNHILRTILSDVIYFLNVFTCALCNSDISSTFVIFSA